jgi:CRISPR-associated endoribonuclease Cas6
VYSALAVKIHGAAMKAIPTEFAQVLHRQEYHPFSIFTVFTDEYLIIRVSALNDEAAVIAKCLKKKGEIRVAGIKEPLKIIGIDEAVPVKADSAGSLIKGNSFRISFVTPAVIKSGGKLVCKPEISKYFYSAVQKYNTFEEDFVSFEEFKEAFDSADVTGYELKGVSYNVSGNIFPGMTGYADIKLPSDEKKAEIIKKAAAYASYSGIGGKTALGMGGIVIS